MNSRDEFPISKKEYPMSKGEQPEVRMNSRGEYPISRPAIRDPAKRDISNIQGEQPE